MRNRESWFLITAGFVCLVVSAMLVHTFRGRFTNDPSGSGMPVMENSIDVSVPNDKYNSTQSVGSNEDKADEIRSEECVVYVTGAVKKSGVFKLGANSRVYNALQAAGGFSDNADKIAVNLAAMVSDGEHLHFPYKGELSESKNVQPAGTVPAATVNSSASSKNTVQTQNCNPSVTSSGKININSADATLLTKLPGVGPKTAEKILEYRASYGAFAKKEDILKVKGIGPSKYNVIKDLITVGK